MAIEDTLGRIATALEKIAASIDSLEIEVPAQQTTTVVNNTPSKEETAPPAEEKKAPAKEKAKAAAKEKKEETPADDDGKAPDLDAVVKALQAYMGANGREATIELLGKYGAKRASDIAEDKRAAFIKEAS
jgi:hypothetical protein